MTAIIFVILILMQAACCYIAYSHGWMMGFLAGRQAEQGSITARIVRRTRERAAWFSQN